MMQIIVMIVHLEPIIQLMMVDDYDGDGLCDDGDPDDDNDGSPDDTDDSDSTG